MRDVAVLRDGRAVVRTEERDGDYPRVWMETREMCGWPVEESTGGYQ